MSVLSDGNTTPPKFNIGDAAFIQYQETFDIIDVTLTMLLTSKTKKYTVQLQDNSAKNVNPDHIFDRINALAPGGPLLKNYYYCPRYWKKNYYYCLQTKNHVLHPKKN